MLLDDLKAIAAAIPAEMKEKNGRYSLEFILAERKAFLSSKKLIYRADFLLDETQKQLRFTEMLKETGSGLSSGTNDISPGFGFKAETYKVGFGKPREGGIAEQSSLFGKQYKYAFDYSEIRKDIEAVAAKAGYGFKYHITVAGL